MIQLDVRARWNVLRQARDEAHSEWLGGCFQIDVANHPCRPRRNPQDASALDYVESLPQARIALERYGDGIGACAQCPRLAHFHNGLVVSSEFHKLVGMQAV